jgi:hypothetical protein
MYIDYNIHDAVLVDMLEDKLGFIAQVSKALGLHGSSNAARIART